MKKITQIPLNIVITWWIFWGIISIFSFTGLYVPGVHTYIILGIFILSLFAGGKCVYFFKSKIASSPCCSELLVERNLNYSFNASIALLFAVLSVLVVRCQILVHQSFTPTVYRSFAFSTVSTVGTLFQNRILENLYFLISSPLLFFIALYALVEFWRKGTFKKLIIAFILNSMDAYIRLGRVNLYLMIVLFMIVFLISDYKIITFLKNKKKELLLIFVAFAGILYIGVQRGYSPTQQFKMFVIDYHTVGFDLFDHELKNPASALNTVRTYGRLSMGGLETIGTIIIRRFDKNYYSPALENSIKMANESIVVGVENPPTVIFNGIKVYNSFYTLLYTFYSDGGYLGIIFGGIVLGFILEFFYQRWIQHHNILDAFFLILFISIGILSIFMSQLEIMRTWIIFVFLILIGYISKVTGRNEIK
ncbi:MAG: oligosaccharide repeat unit polymerase [Bacteriovorax sp.]|nr:oligosaccharide repeat unit polymerase [Bacteriovorax sp.]